MRSVFVPGSLQLGPRSAPSACGLYERESRPRRPVAPPSSHWLVAEDRRARLAPISERQVAVSLPFGVILSYSNDMVATDETLGGLLERVNAATLSLQRSATVPAEIAALIDSVDPVLHAEAPLRLEADPYLTTMLFAAAFRAEKALRHDNAEAQRRDLRIALEQFRQALRDIVSNRPFAAD